MDDAVVLGAAAAFYTNAGTSARLCQRGYVMAKVASWYGRFADAASGVLLLTVLPVAAVSFLAISM